MNNPFQLTRAADLDEEQTIRLWVDPEDNLAGMLRPASPLPMFILGGRGSGKTHLMRYYSYPIQRRVLGAATMADRVSKCRYLGIHTRCMGLNTSRFSGKRMEHSKWNDLFSFYLELWFGQLVLQTAIEFIRDSQAESTYEESHLISSLVGLFDRPLDREVKNLAEFAGTLRRFQRNLDSEVNMASFRDPTPPEFIVTPGRLTFGVAQKFAEHVPCLKGVIFTLFIDEYEHLFEQQQQHVNTLIRERENPVSFKVGARLHGLRTHKTRGGDEELKEGSDYELLFLDAVLRKNKAQYEKFALELCAARIRFALSELPVGWTAITADEFKKCFATSMHFKDRVRQKLVERGGESPWLQQVQSHLQKHLHKLRSLGITDTVEVDRIVTALAFKQDVMIEKLNTFLFYRAWSNNENLVSAATTIGKLAAAFYCDNQQASLHRRTLSHFRDDLKAQMLSELNVSHDEMLEEYVGLKTWIRMSDGIARNLLTTLKRVIDWCLFRGENPYSPVGISLHSQTRGVRDSSTWFVNDANVLGPEHGLVETGIKRIAMLLSKLRFSDKPPECSLCRFTVDLNALDELPRRILECCEMWSLLIRTADRKDRNSGAHKVQFRINGLVAPDYNLPISTRGNIDLNGEQATAIFGTRDDAAFNGLLRERLGRSSPPFTTNLGRETEALRNAPSDNEAMQDELRLF